MGSAVGLLGSNKVVDRRLSNEVSWISPQRTCVRLVAREGSLLNWNAAWWGVVCCLTTSWEFADMCLCRRLHYGNIWQHPSLWYKQKRMMARHKCVNARGKLLWCYLDVWNINQTNSSALLLVATLFRIDVAKAIIHRLILAHWSRSFFYSRLSFQCSVWPDKTRVESE